MSAQPPSAEPSADAPVPADPSSAIESLLAKKERKDAARGFRKKNPSHRGFYPQFLKGCATAIAAIRLLATTPRLRAQLRAVAAATAQATAVYLAIATALFFLIRFLARNNAPTFPNFLLQASPVLTILINLFFGDKLKKHNVFFFQTLEILNPQFSKALQAISKKTAQKSFGRDAKLKRTGKLLAFRLAAKAITHLIPATKQVLLPVLKFASLTHYLGRPLAAGLALLEAIPGAQGGWFEETSLSFGEAVIDSSELAEDIVHPYVARMDDQKMHKYFWTRFQGYFTGVGFIFALLVKVPIVSILVMQVAEIAAAMEVLDVIARNHKKANRQPLLLEDLVPAYGSSVPQDPDSEDEEPATKDGDKTGSSAPTESKKDL